MQATESFEDKWFALRIAVINTFGYLQAILIVSYVDPQLTSHVLYGARSYRFGYWLSLLAPVILVSTYFSLIRSKTRGGRCISSCTPLILAGACALPFFRPEFPHAGLVASIALFSTSSLIATWLRYTHSDLSYLGDPSVPMQVKIDGLKSVLLIWQTLMIATAAGFLALLVPAAMGVISSNPITVKKAPERFVLNMFSMISFGIISIAILIGPIRELVAKVLFLTGAFSTIRDIHGSKSETL